MPKSPVFKIGSALLIGLLALADPTITQAQPVSFRATNGDGRDTLYVGSRATIRFSVDPNGANFAAITVPLGFSFSNGNVLAAGSNLDVTLPPSRFEPMDVEPPYGQLQGTDPDTLLFGFLDFSGQPTPDSNMILARLMVAPTDTGRVGIDSITMFALNHLSALDQNAQELPIDWQPADIVVLPCPGLMGDVDANRRIDAADIIWCILSVFKCDFCWPVPDWRIGDVNCSGAFTSADIIYLVNYCFKGGPPPCECFPLP